MTYLLQLMMSGLLMTLCYTPYLDLGFESIQTPAILNLYQRGLSRPAFPSVYETHDLISRGEVLQMLYACAGYPDVGYALEEGSEIFYEDVPSDHPVYAALRWIDSFPLVIRSADGLIHPDQPIRQRELIGLLYRLDERYVSLEGAPSLEYLPLSIRQAYRWALSSGILNEDQIVIDKELSKGENAIILSNYLYRYPGFYHGGYQLDLHTVEIERVALTNGIFYRSVHPSDTLILLAHGLGAGMFSMERQAIILANAGYDVYAMEFRGQGDDLDNFDMSLDSEIEDLEALLEAFHYEHTYIYGASQGGLVASEIAAKNKYDISGLILDYPAYMIPDQIRELFAKKEDIPDRFDYLGQELDKVYALSAYDLYPLEEASKYKGPVLIIHGDQDPVVDIDYSYKANEAYPNSELYVMENYGHVFEEDEGVRKETDKVLAWLKEQNDRS